MMRAKLDYRLGKRVLRAIGNTELLAISKIPIASLALEATYGPGTMIYHPDPHTEPEMRTETGGAILYIQYMGPTTREAPIYDDRFNLTKRRPVELERTDV